MELMEDDTEMDGYQSEESGPDSDEELQEAFRTGKMQPGLTIVKEKPVKVFANNEGAILAKLEEIRLRLPWLERLDMVNQPAPMAPELKRDQEQLMADAGDDSLVEDDFKREMLFYRQAQAAVLEGIPRLHAEGIPTRRPDDFLAQMVKTDEQMDKVRKFLIRQKTQKEMSEKARKLRELKKTGKRTQVEVQQRKLKEKKDMMDKMKKFRKGTDKSLDFLESPEENKRNQPTNVRNQKKRMTQKRQDKDTKFGFGGRKKGQKRNTAESTADTSWVTGKSRAGKKFVSKKGGKGAGAAARGAKGAGGGAAGKRPGKQTRQNIKSKAKSRK